MANGKKSQQAAPEDVSGTYFLIQVEQLIFTLTYRGSSRKEKKKQNKSRLAPLTTLRPLIWCGCVQSTGRKPFPRSLAPQFSGGGPRQGAAAKSSINSDQRAAGAVHISGQDDRRDKKKPKKAD